MWVDIEATAGALPMQKAPATRRFIVNGNSKYARHVVAQPIERSCQFSRVHRHPTTCIRYALQFTPDLGGVRGKTRDGLDGDRNSQLRSVRPVRKLLTQHAEFGSKQRHPLAQVVMQLHGKPTPLVNSGLRSIHPCVGRFRQSSDFPG